VDNCFLGLKYWSLLVEFWVVQRRAMIVGLGAGLLPMFIHNHIPVDTIQVLKESLVATIDYKFLHLKSL